MSARRIGNRSIATNRRWRWAGTSPRAGAGGQLVIGTLAPGGPERCSNLPIVQYDAARMQAGLGASFELLETRAETHRTPAGKDPLFDFFRFVKAPT